MIPFMAMFFSLERIHIDRKRSKYGKVFVKSVGSCGTFGTDIRVGRHIVLYEDACRALSFISVAKAMQSPPKDVTYPSVLSG